ncbi:unnamed protein product [Natator depressus]
MDIFNGEAQLDGDRGAPKSPFSGTSASSNPNLPGYSCHHVCNTSLCNWLGESGSQAGTASAAPVPGHQHRGCQGLYGAADLRAAEDLHRVLLHPEPQHH